jgi:hypothetical protein
VNSEKDVLRKPESREKPDLKTLWIRASVTRIGLLKARYLETGMSGFEKKEKKKKKNK